MTFTFYALPAIVGLVTKAVMFAYVRWTRVHNALTRLYLALLVVLAVYNVFEVSIFVNHQDGVITPLVEYAMRALSGVIDLIVAIILQIALITALSRNSARGNLSALGLVAVYAPTLALEVLLWGSSLLVVGFVPMSYTYTKVPGPLYFLFELYVVAYLSGAIALLLYGAWAHPIAFRRAQNKLMLVGLFPLTALATTIFALQRFGFRGFNATATATIGLTILLAFAAYATHQRRLPDVEIFIPWSKWRRRKLEFYDRIRAAIDDPTLMASMDDILQLVSDTLRCPIALVSGSTPSFAMAGDALDIARFPMSEVRKVDEMIVANEIAETMPAMYELMKRYQVAAIVPFHPHSEAAASWMLLGTAFSESVYSPLDFKMVNLLFARLTDRFLDTQLLAHYIAGSGQWLRIYSPALSSLEVRTAETSERAESPPS